MAVAWPRSLGLRKRIYCHRPGANTSIILRPSHIYMTFNIGGALPDISWLDQGEVPVASMQCWNEFYAPYGVGDIIVPSTGDFVVEAMGSLTVQETAMAYGNNDIFDGMSIELTDSWYANGSGSQNSATAAEFDG